MFGPPGIVGTDADARCGSEDGKAARALKGRRQWCDMKDCGNVAKVRRFRERTRDVPDRRS
jgi:hypothetical protein